jgi:alkanesulfonate monooxygenase SsuD/methylene tetrahydromethanopterin reductase-like flavin-dependent oxidoreductase (luciferase family)
MRFGLGPYDLISDDQQSSASRYEEMLEQAAEAEELGFDSVWLAERHFTPDGACSSSEAAAAGVALRTRATRIGVFTTVNVTNPLYIAEDVAVLDNIANGRVIVAAQGGSAGDLAGYKIDPKTADGRFAEAIQIMLKSWAPTSFAHQGEFWRVPKGDFTGNPFAKGVTEVNVTPKPAQLSVPLWLAAPDRAGVERAARLGFPFVGSAFDTAAELKAKCELHRSTVAASGRLADGLLYPAVREVYLAETMQEARADVEKPLLALYQAFHRHGVLADVPGDFEQLARDRFIVGDVDHVAAEIDRYQRQVGINYLICRMCFPGLSAGKTMAAMKFFGQAIVPEFRMASFPPEIRKRTRAGS